MTNRSADESTMLSTRNLFRSLSRAADYLDQFGGCVMNANSQIAYLGYQIVIDQDKTRFTARVSTRAKA